MKCALCNSSCIVPHSTESRDHRPSLRVTSLAFLSENVNSLVSEQMQVRKIVVVGLVPAAGDGSRVRFNDSRTSDRSRHYCPLGRTWDARALAV